jgi:hypothetical protein
MIKFRKSRNAEVKKIKLHYEVEILNSTDKPNVEKKDKNMIS